MTQLVMRALVVDSPGVLKIAVVPQPHPGTGEVLVKVRAVGVCASDLELLAGTRSADYVRYPIVPGHEWSGTVCDVGPGVQGLTVGMPVVAEGFRSCGRCRRCSAGTTNLCEATYAETGFTHNGAFADYVLVPSRLVHRLQVDADFCAAALLEPAACVAEGLDLATLEHGLDIAVVGDGTLAALAMKMLRLRRPARLTMAGVRQNLRAFAANLGADDAIRMDCEEIPAHFRDRFDFVFEASPRPESVWLAAELVRRGGTVVLEGNHGRSASALPTDIMPLKHLTIRGIFGASTSSWTTVVALFQSGKRGHAKLPVDGQKNPRWWPRDLPIGGQENSPL
jgi:threonine dehydrogenase-like Zn-dependent dehydrogenase